MNEMPRELFGVNARGRLEMDGIDLKLIAEIFHTPVYVMSDRAIRAACRTFMTAMRQSFGERFRVAYASKALSAGFLYPIMQSEGLNADVASGGELYTALRAGFPAANLHFHGNNKSDEELEYAVRSGIGSVIVDNFEEIIRLNNVTKWLGREWDGKKINVLLRVKPGVEAHTHASVDTGRADSKFGFDAASGAALEAVRIVIAKSALRLRGFHCHIGSQIQQDQPFVQAADKLIGLMADVRDRFDVTLPELNIGGGFGVRYTNEDRPFGIPAALENIAQAIKQGVTARGLDMPVVVIEPGRSLVAAAGVTLYRVGAVKSAPGARTYVMVDGGMADNPRYALYASRYEMCIANKASEPARTLVSVAGKCCESGDMIARDIHLQKAEAGDILCVFSTGAYNYSMASNYNRLPRPPIVLIEGTACRTVVRRETYEDLVRNDIL